MMPLTVYRRLECDAGRNCAHEVRLLQYVENTALGRERADTVIWDFTFVL